MSSKIDYLKQLQVVENWIIKKGYKVVYIQGMAQEGGTFFDHLGEIHIHWGLRPEEKLYVLLHEAGHLLLMDNNAYYRKTFPAAAEVIDYPRTNYQKIGILEEEYHAWYRALKLAKKLKIPLNLKRFLNYKTKCLLGHLDYMFRR